MKNEIIKLVHITNTQDADGFPVSTRIEDEFWAEVKSVKRTEFYMAESAKTKVSDVFIMNNDDYKAFKTTNGKPSLVVYDGDEYKIIRPYRNPKTRDMELTCVGVDE